LSSFEQKLFVVGDVKQSIYGFRGANPKNFLNKKNRYIDIDKTDENSPQKIILGNNFRCHPKACEFINYFFKLFMTEQTGDIIYNSEEELVASAVYPSESNNVCDIHIINSKDSILTDTELEALHVASYIKEVMKSGKVIRENDNTLRNAKYSDFCILLRSAKHKAAIIAEELKRQGIPVSYSSEEFANTTEVSLILSLLKVLDNPENDVELLTVLMSPIFAFTADELAELRTLNRKGNLYSCIVYSAQNGNTKANKFLKRIEKLRMLSVVETLPRLISIILYETGYIDIVSAMDDGAKRRENLLLLLSYAEKLSGDAFDSIPSFISYISKNSSGAKASVSSQGNNVRIMSIHSSKGLQFPVCMVLGLGSKFNDNEAQESVLYKTDFGIGFKYFDESEKKPVTSIAREAILDKIRAERLEEELRLFYVAMTRTQDKLVLLGTVSDAYKKADELKTQLLASSSEITFDLFNKTKSYLDWLMLSVLLLKSGSELRGAGHSLMLSDSDVDVNIRVLDGEQIVNNITVNTPQSYEPDFKIAEKLKENLRYKYPFADIAKTESKASVSMLANSAESVKYAFKSQPAFLSVGGITATERGTAMHKVMQFFDFSKYNTVEEELERLYEWQYISEREYKAINVAALKSFFRSEIFGRIKNAKSVNREMRFLTEMQADTINPLLNENCKNEKIIVQGAVDLCFDEQDGIVILDFKTDRVDDISVLKDIYSEQLNIYALACEKIFKKPVKQKIIYSFALQDSICI
ncbi:MAG: UvrD-helicase domain-containing protein, partial [Clostridia bacterium]|nr:UvrD-helicase domain-containing protein [Clostridia bacterium]